MLKRCTASTVNRSPAVICLLLCLLLLVVLNLSPKHLGLPRNVLGFHHTTLRPQREHPRDQRTRFIACTARRRHSRDDVAQKGDDGAHE